MVYEEGGRYGGYRSTCEGEIVVYGDTITPVAVEKNHPWRTSTLAIFDVCIDDAVSLVRGQKRGYDGIIPVEECLPFVDELWLIKAVHEEKLHAATSGSPALYYFDLKELKNLRDEMLKANGKNLISEQNLYAVGYNKTEIYFGTFSSDDEAKEFIGSVTENDIVHYGNCYYIKFKDRTVMARPDVSKANIVKAVQDIRNMQIFMNNFAFSV